MKLQDGIWVYRMPTTMQQSLSDADDKAVPTSKSLCLETQVFKYNSKESNTFSFFL